MTTQDPLLVRAKRRVGPILNTRAAMLARGIPLPHTMGEATQIDIARRLVEGNNLIARVGETEGRAAAFYLRHRVAADSGSAPPYEPLNRERLKLLAGYFPTTDPGIDRLAALYLQSIAAIDLYAAWTPHDALLCPPTARRCRIIDLDPFFGTRRWPLAWEGRRVTIVSPFKTTIMAQWEKRAHLFAQPTLGEADLKVVQAPQTQCETDTEGQSWFDNLDRLDSMVAATDPQIVIIGAGAYGLPVGARAKARGASVIVLGGSTQLLFGIMGNRWAINPAYAALQNSHWTRPGLEERPPGFQNFETAGGAYW
ncbi:hypothetical protein [Sandaracinobacteroides saxicola]|uniref:Uncharacterized protein n=1 Tax=Sandaracinobacteroides saxicola TaxID=2759707 RepID=A0A7G5IKM0_9SPHN|nr:hypothetical protein [Sandaracinobacteroides saxicola]QMW23912.1 hypothetical protein H3309_05420 [Sandaracinobacteroides saxicola]